MVEVRRTELLGLNRAIYFISLCFPLCPGGKEHQALALILTLAPYTVPLTYSSHVLEPLYDPQGLEDREMAHPGIGRGEQPGACLPASTGKRTSKVSFPEAGALVLKAELGPRRHQLCVLCFFQQSRSLPLARKQTL